MSSMTPHGLSTALLDSSGTEARTAESRSLKCPAQPSGAASLRFAAAFQSELKRGPGGGD